MGVSDATVERALVRADASATERLVHSRREDLPRWQLQVAELVAAKPSVSREHLDTNYDASEVC
jgi:hypothetical protein